MKNYYEPSKLLSDTDIAKFELAFEQSWSRQTAYPDSQNNWTSKNKALGQCAITALIIYDLFGGRMIYDKSNFHIWNELPDGTQQDFSRKQFLRNREFTIYKYKTKEDVLFDETGKRTKIDKRYKLLKMRFINNLEKRSL